MGVFNGGAIAMCSILTKSLFKTKDLPVSPCRGRINSGSVTYRQILGVFSRELRFHTLSDAFRTTTASLQKSLSQITLNTLQHYL